MKKTVFFAFFLVFLSAALAQDACETHTNCTGTTPVCGAENACVACSTAEECEETVTCEEGQETVCESGGSCLCKEKGVAEKLMEAFAENWLLLAVAIIAIFIALKLAAKIVKTVVTVIILAIIAWILFKLFA